MSDSTQLITAAIARLRALSQTSIQSGWRYFDGDLAIATATDPTTWQQWQPGIVNDRDHHPWQKGKVVRWFSQMITVPTDLQGYPLTGLCLRLALLWWAREAQVFVNGELVQEGDLFDCAPRLLLSLPAKLGDEFAVALRLVSPGHDSGALMKSVCHYEAPTPEQPLEPSFIADELAVLQSYLAQFEPEKVEVLGDAIAQLDWAEAFNHALTQLRQTLLPLAAPIKQRRIKLLGHAHLDMAWLWTVEETWQAAERTFRSALNLQKDFPELIFCHSTPALYEWIEHNRPELFAAIQAQVKAGKWEALGGLWVEPEMNLISGEAIARQILYGQQYFQHKFGAISRFAWLPDTFGFTWQLPQLLKQGGIDYFVTQKLRWNDTTKFPHELFQWQAPDGTQVLALMSAPIGEGIDPLKMATFAWDWETKTGIPISLWLPGIGDHGGGPTRDMLEVARRWAQSPFFPQLEFTTAERYMQEIGKEGDRGQETGAEEASGASEGGEVAEDFSWSSPLASLASLASPPLPIWNSELYLEFHRGCYTTHAEQKQFNRGAESLLFQAELWAALAAIATGAEYPKQGLEQAWKKTLFNQFHDILPGSSITSVFLEANVEWKQVKADAGAALERALSSITQNIQLPPVPHPAARAVVIFNALNWQRSEVVHWFTHPEMQVQQVYDAIGQPVAFNQTVLEGLFFTAKDIPAVGYKVFWLLLQPSTLTNSAIAAIANSYVLENSLLKVEVDAKTGDLASLFDKQQQREVLSGAGNQLQAFTDQGQYWDAWNIDPTYADHPLPPSNLKAIQWLEQSSVRSRLRVTRVLNQSEFIQDYVLEADSPLLKIATEVDWQEKHVLVKAAFPLNLEADFATYEIPCGAIQRPTKPQTEAEKAQWEVPAMRWADLSDGNYGVSLLNDCKYGYDATPNQLRLTLLRGSEFPDPEADQGSHAFTYAIYPHAGDWKQAQTVQKGYELNLPLQLVAISTSSQPKTLPPTGSLLDLGAENLVLMALKQAEAGDGWILRCYECHGESAELNLTSDVLDLSLQKPVDLLEQPTTLPGITDNIAKLRPWQIASFKLSTEKS